VKDIITERSSGFGFGSVDDGITALRGFYHNNFGTALISTAGQLTGEGAALLLTHNAKSATDAFFTKKVAERLLETGASKRPRRHVSFDYDGVGVFFKCSVDLSNFEERAYNPCIIEYSTAYHGSEPWEKFGKKYGFTPATICLDLDITWEVGNDGQSLISVAKLVDSINNTFHTELLPIDLVPKIDKEGYAIFSDIHLPDSDEKLAIKIQSYLWTYYPKPGDYQILDPEQGLYKVKPQKDYSSEVGEFHDAGIRIRLFAKGYDKYLPALSPEEIEYCKAKIQAVQNPLNS
jgi:hypothetical protein